jgi:hypothetical protein
MMLTLVTTVCLAVTFPREAVSALYDKIDAFKAWPLESGMTDFPRSVEEYGMRHVAGWSNVTHEERKRWSGHTIMHRYSTDVSRAKHVHEWKEVRNTQPLCVGAQYSAFVCMRLCVYAFMRGAYFPCRCAILSLCVCFLSPAARAFSAQSAISVAFMHICVYVGGLFSATTAGCGAPLINA